MLIIMLKVTRDKVAQYSDTVACRRILTQHLL